MRTHIVTKHAVSSSKLPLIHLSLQRVRRVLRRVAAVPSACARGREALLAIGGAAWDACAAVAKAAVALDAYKAGEW